jgi:hypothetical protein
VIQVLSEETTQSTGADPPSPPKPDPQPVPPKPDPQPNPPKPDPKPTPPKPDPKPEPTPVVIHDFPEAGNYYINDTTGKISCLHAQFAAQFAIKVVNKTVTPPTDTIQYINVQNATAEGSCPETLTNATELTLTLKFETVAKTPVSAVLQFKRINPGNNSESHWLDSITLPDFTDIFGEFFFVL